LLWIALAMFLLKKIIKMNVKVILFFISQIGLFILCMIVVLDIARLATFLFYDKNETNLPKKYMQSPVLGTKMYSLKNIFVVVFLIPTCFLIRKGGVKLTFWSLVGYYGASLVCFILITISASFSKKIQKEVTSRNQAKAIILLEIIILIIVIFVLNFTDFES